MSDQSTSTNTTADANASLFPYRLYDMLEECELHNKSHIVSWLPDGKAFKVHQVPVFVEIILPTYFRQSKYKSYQRQLNLWGFERITTNGPEKGAYYHKDFLKGQHDMVKLLTRQRGNKTDSPTTLSIKFTKPRSPKVAKGTSLSKQQRIKNPTSLAQSIPLIKAETAIVTPPISPRELPDSQDINDAQVQGGPQEVVQSVSETPFFEGCEFFLLDEDAKYYELADVLLETGFMTIPANLDDEIKAAPTGFSMPASSSTLCRV